MSSVAAGQMSAVKTGQMLAAGTGQMFAGGKGQLRSVARTDICLVSTHNVEVPEDSILAISQTAQDSDRRSDSKFIQMARNVSRLVVRS